LAGVEPDKVPTNLGPRTKKQQLPTISRSNWHQALSTETLSETLSRRTGNQQARTTWRRANGQKQGKAIMRQRSEHGDIKERITKSPSTARANKVGARQRSTTRAEKYRIERSTRLVLSFAAPPCCSSSALHQPHPISASPPPTDQHLLINPSKKQYHRNKKNCSNQPLTSEFQCGAPTSRSDRQL
jgi:hypothetical protein